METTNEEKKSYEFKSPPVHNFQLENVVYHLLQTDRFYANFMMNTTIVRDNKGVPTAAASVRKGEIFLYFNTEFMKRWPVEGQAAILKHEILHLMMDHCGNRGQQFGSLNHRLKNIAMDCANNQYIQHLPDEGEGGFQCVTLDGLKKQTGLDLAPGEPWEYYYLALMKHCEDSGKISYVVDNHGMMEEGDGNGQAESSINKAAVQAAVEKAVKQCAGNVGGEVLKALNLFDKAKIPWKQQLRNFVAKARATETKLTRNRPHRRFELAQPGRKKKRNLILGVPVDTSGSVSDEAYSQFMTEIYHLSKNTNATYVIQADAVIQKVDKIKGGKPKKEKLSERKGYGGTAYQPAIQRCIELGCDAIIYFGDMDAADVPSNPGIPVLWVRVGKSSPPGDFGRVLDLD